MLNILKILFHPFILPLLYNASITSRCGAAA